MRLIKKAVKKIKKPLKKVYRFHMLRHVYPNIYAKHARVPVNMKKAVFVEVRENELSSNMRYIYERLREKGFELSVHFLHMSFSKRKDYASYCKAMAADIADAGYIFLDESSDVFAALPIRKKTVVTQLWHACGAFKKFGLSTADKLFGENAKTLEKYPFHGNYTHMTVSAPEVVWAYEEAMNLAGTGVVKPLGISRTDYFFDEKAKQAAEEHLYKVFPQARGKRVILYAPTFRGHVAGAKTPNEIDITRFAGALQKDSVLLFKLHPFVKIRTEIPADCESFARDVTDELSIEELLLTADVCITDYSSLVFEYALLERPMLFFAYDLDEYYDWRGFYYPYEDFVPGPIVKTQEALLEELRRLPEGFDKERVISFKEKYMSACDGHATDRILQCILGDSPSCHSEERSDEES